MHVASRAIERWHATKYTDYYAIRARSNWL